MLKTTASDVCSTLPPTMEEILATFIQQPSDRVSVTSLNVIQAMNQFAEVAASHNDVALIVAGLRVMLERPNALTDNCINVILDMCDEIIGQIEQDEVNQAEEVTA